MGNGKMSSCQLVFSIQVIIPITPGELIAFLAISAFIALVPVVASVACMNGAFDTHLYPNTRYGYAHSISFGEGVLLSNASGIAYIDGSRVNYGGWNAYLEKGYLYVIKGQRHLFRVHTARRPSTGITIATAFK